MYLVYAPGRCVSNHAIPSLVSYVQKAVYSTHISPIGWQPSSSVT